MKLTARKIETAKAGKYEDGNGLRLVVSPQLSKRWVYRFTFNKTRREMGLGSYPSVSLRKARDLIYEYAKQVSAGVDPIENRRKPKDATPSFKTCAARYIKAHRRGWKNTKHQHQWVNTIKTYANPVIGDVDINKIDLEHVLEILRPIWLQKTETAKRLQGRIENIIDFANAHRYRSGDNPARWRGFLDKILVAPSKVKKPNHFPAMPYSQLPEFMDELYKKKTTSSYALIFLILTATRSGEVLKAKWQEINFNELLWIIPAERMKSGNEHRVPLSTHSLELLSNIPRHLHNPFVFPGTKSNKPLSSMSLVKLMRSLGYGCGFDNPYVPHGFRSSFRDWSGEVSYYPRDVAEMALAHTIPNKAEAAYRRGDLLKKRREMMQDWSDFLQAHDKKIKISVNCN